MPEVVQLAARRAAVMHASATSVELPAALERIFPVIYTALREQGVTDLGHAITVYHGMDPNQMDLSAGIEIDDEFEPAEPLDLLELPACDAVRSDHFGPYDQLYLTHQAILPFLTEIERMPMSGPIERYITDPEAEPDQSKWHTEIWLPLS